MKEDEFELIINDLTQDINGLENIVSRLKQRQVNSQNADLQLKDLSSANTLSQQLRNTIKELEKLLIGG